MIVPEHTPVQPVTPYRDADAVAVAAARFIGAALRHDDSLFTPGVPIWSADVLSKLYEHFVDDPDTTQDSFMNKLRRQLADADAETIQLAAEWYYVYCIAPTDIHGATKRKAIEEILSWSSVSVAIPPDLDAALDFGISTYGSALTRRYDQMVFLIEFARKWKQLPEDERLRALDDPWIFRDIVYSVPSKGAQSQREAILRIVHPNTFESLVSQYKKQQIVNYFRSQVQHPNENIDRQLIEIRGALEKQFGPGFDFYEPRVLQLWDAGDPPPPVPPVPLPVDRLDELSDALLLERSYLARVERLLRDKGQVIFYGPPGTGKTYVAHRLAHHYAGTDGSVELLQFHPSYAYEDFVEGYRPRPEGGFVLRHGPLMRIAEAAHLRPDARHILVIDELNRGNVAKVFGELYYLLEYRGAEMRLQYRDDPFRMPKNVWIIATMNTADRSIALVDAALRRRFYFVPFFPDTPPVEGLLRRWLVRNKPDLLWVADVLDRANHALGDRHVAIGPSHFMKANLTEEWVELIWDHAVLPYLAEQFFGEDEQLKQFQLATLRTGTPMTPEQAPETNEVADAPDHAD